MRYEVLRYEICGVKVQVPEREGAGSIGSCLMSHAGSMGSCLMLPPSLVSLSLSLSSLFL